MSDPTVTIEPATPARWDDANHALTGGGDGKMCQCQWWTLTNAEWNASTVDERRDLLRSEVSAGPAPGLIAYVNDEPAGWVRVAPRTAQRRIARTKIIAASTAEPFDDDSVWAITCFVVRREHRRTGLMAELMAAAVNFARDGGARAIEGYPIDTSQGKPRSNDLFRGTLSAFLAAGFTKTATTKPSQPLMTLTLTP